MPNHRGERRSFGEEPWHNGKPKGKGRRWYGKFTGPDRGRHTPGFSFDTKAAVEGWYQAEKRLIDRMREEGTIGEWLPPRARQEAESAARERASVTVEDMVTKWLEYKATSSWEESTRQTNQRQLDRRLLEVEGRVGLFRSLSLEGVTRQDANDWWTAVWEQFPDTAPTNNSAKKHLTAAFKWATREGMIPANPVDLETRRVKVGERGARNDMPTREELSAVLAETPERYKFPTALAYFHGLRTEEVLGLRRWQVRRSVSPEGNVSYMIDLSDRKRAKAAVRLSVEGKQTMVDKPLKTEASYRTVPVFAEFIDMAETHMSQYVTPGADALVATSGTGKRALDVGWNKVLKSAAERAGARSDIRRHDGRRYIATALMEAGASPVVAGRFIGDDNPDVIREHYLRQTEEHRVESLKAVGESLTGVTKTSGS